MWTFFWSLIICFSDQNQASDFSLLARTSKSHQTQMLNFTFLKQKQTTITSCFLHQRITEILTGNCFPDSLVSLPMMKILNVSFTAGSWWQLFTSVLRWILFSNNLEVKTLMWNLESCFMKAYNYLLVFLETWSASNTSELLRSCHWAV